MLGEHFGACGRFGVRAPFFCTRLSMRMRVLTQLSVWNKRIILVTSNNKRDSTMERNIQKLNERLQDLGEAITFTNEERKRLQSVFTEGTLDEGICQAGWVRFFDSKGKSHYTGNFSKAVTDSMIQIATERIEKIEKEMEQLYDNFSLQAVADYLNKVFKEYASVISDSQEWRRISKKASIAKADVEVGKCNYESSKTPEYECVVIRENDYYSALLKIEKNENGYEIEKRAILCGTTWIKCDKYGIFNVLKELTQSLFL